MFSFTRKATESDIYKEVQGSEPLCCNMTEIQIWQNPVVFPMISVFLTTSSDKPECPAALEKRDISEHLCVTVTESKSIPFRLRKPPAAFHCRFHPP